MIQLLIVDDHAIVRQGIRQLLADTPGIKVIGDASSGEDALRFARDHQVDVVLLDIVMPGISGLETTQRLLHLNPDLKIIALTMIANEPYPYRTMHAGAAGYLTKDASVDELIMAIKKVFAGESYIAPQIAQNLALKSIHATANDEVSVKSLSERELEVMRMIANGLKVQEISEKLCLSTKTVNSYRYRIFEKLKIKNDVELTLLAVRLRMLDNLLL